MTEVQDIETIHQDIPLEVFVSSSSEDTPEMPPKRTRGRPQTALWRYNADGTYNNKPNDKAYFAKYMAVRKECTCGKMIAVGEIYKHKKYKICIKMTAQRMTAIENDS